MRRMKFVAIAAVSIALVFSSAPLALARGRGASRRVSPPYQVTKPSVVSGKVVMGVSFDATGVVLPAISADDASTTVAIEVYGVPVRRHAAPLMTVPVTLSALTDTGTAYAATLSLPKAGAFLLVAAVSRDGLVVVRSAPRPVLAVLPYKVSKPRVLSPKVVAGESFDATGLITPSIAADDASTTVSVLVMRVGRRNRLTQVASFDAVLAADAVDGSDYSAAVTLPTAGRYVLVAVVTHDGAVLGRSSKRVVKATAAAAPAPIAPTSMKARRR